jgi:hypothetical protein
MNQTSHTSILRKIAGGLCAVFLHLCLTTSAFATCGDWLAHHDSQDTAETPRQIPAEAPRTCQGPECGKPAESPLPDAPKPPIPTDDEQRLHHTSQKCASPPGLSQWLADEALILSEGVSLRVERPPRV